MLVPIQSSSKGVQHITHEKANAKVALPEEILKKIGVAAQASAGVSLRAVAHLVSPLFTQSEVIEIYSEALAAIPDCAGFVKIIYQVTSNSEQRMHLLAIVYHLAASVRDQGKNISLSLLLNLMNDVGIETELLNTLQPTGEYKDFKNSVHKTIKGYSENTVKALKQFPLFEARKLANDIHFKTAVVDVAPEAIAHVLATIVAPASEKPALKPLMSLPIKKQLPHMGRALIKQACGLISSGLLFFKPTEKSNALVLHGKVDGQGLFDDVYRYIGSMICSCLNFRLRGDLELPLENTFVQTFTIWVLTQRLGKESGSWNPVKEATEEKLMEIFGGGKQLVTGGGEIARWLSLALADHAIEAMKSTMISGDGKQILEKLDKEMSSAHSGEIMRLVKSSPECDVAWGVAHRFLAATFCEAAQRHSIITSLQEGNILDNLEFLGDFDRKLQETEKLAEELLCATFPNGSAHLPVAPEYREVVWDLLKNEIVPKTLSHMASALKDPKMRIEIALKCIGKENMDAEEFERFLSQHLKLELNLRHQIKLNEMKGMIQFKIEKVLGKHSERIHKAVAVLMETFFINLLSKEVMRSMAFLQDKAEGLQAHLISRKAIKCILNANH